MSKSRALTLATWLTMLVLLVTGAFAQESAVKGGIAAVITDQQGAVVPDATITVTGPTGSRTYTTDSSGQFVAPLLTLGKYSVKIEHQGFKP
ncbi:MAG TPA: carboxypeptidase-like regulatory domain-containing protein, partial [Candidatus Acidoferrum sp.]|nr:carboxypeptidase-like regulatory domain-containing protein [Candidatus Acidoferrum sp.]